MRNLFYLLKPVIIFSIILLAIITLYSQGLIGTYLNLFNKGWHLEFIKDFSKGYQLTGHYFLAYNSENPENYIPVENYCDDPAIYYFVPFLENILGVKTVVAYWILLGSIVSLGYSICVIGFALLLENYFAKIISYILAGIFAFFCLHILDMHILPYFTTSLIPMLCLVRKKFFENNKALYPALALIITGILIGLSNQFRSHSGTGLLVIIIASLLFESKISYFKKIMFIFLLVFFTPLCKIYLSQKFEERDNWIQARYNKQITYNNPVHPFWHSLYIGLGFINNPYNIIYDDLCGFNKAKKTDPTNDMMNLETRNIEKYEDIIRTEYFLILRNDFMFVLKTYFIKFFYIFLFAIVFFNYGFIILKKIKLNYRQAIPVLLGILIYISPGILVVPLPFYFLGALNILVISNSFLIDSFFTKYKF